MATTTKRRPAASRKKKHAKANVFQRARAALATYLGRQSDDVWGLLLILAGVLAALGIYADLTGVVGQLLDRGTGAVLGR